MRYHFQNKERRLDVAQALELLLCKHKALNSNSSSTKNIKNLRIRFHKAKTFERSLLSDFSTYWMLSGDAEMENFTWGALALWESLKQKISIFLYKLSLL
jgi:hypothetical protein